MKAFLIYEPELLFGDKEIGYPLLPDHSAVILADSAAEAVMAVGGTLGMRELMGSWEEVVILPKSLFTPAKEGGEEEKLLVYNKDSFEIFITSEDEELILCLKEVPLIQA